MAQLLTTLEFLRRFVAGDLTADMTTALTYPPGVWTTLGFQLVEVDLAFAKLAMDADLEKHGNQLGIIHGGILCELADAAIGTAHTTTLAEGESLATVELKVNFFRPALRSRIVASARRVNAGRTLSYYVCEVLNEEGKLLASVNSTVMTLRGDQARGR